MPAPDRIDWRQIAEIALHADEALIERAREAAAARKTTLEAELQRWLEAFVADGTVDPSRTPSGSETPPQSIPDGQQPKPDHRSEGRVYTIRDLVREMHHVRPGRKFTRDEMNERR